MGYLASDAKILIVGGILGWIMPIPFLLCVAIYLYAEAKSVDTAGYVKGARDWVLARGVAYYMPRMFMARPGDAESAVPQQAQPLSGDADSAFDAWAPQDPQTPVFRP